ncbi:hypothetical protein A2U01_0105571, partial [Trifolium medium]|nr:hypothetical protein [Trifolium medium]
KLTVDYGGMARMPSLESSSTSRTASITPWKLQLHGLNNNIINP